MEICTEKVTVKTVGEDGAAVGSAITRAMMGFLLDIKLDYGATTPATTDLTVSDAQGSVLVVSDSATDALIAPRQKCVDNDNAAITDSHAMFPLNGPLTFALAQSNALTAALVATVRYLRL